MCNSLSEGYSWVMLPILITVAVGSCLAMRVLLFPIVRAAIRATPATWDDVFVDRKVLHRLSLVGPALIFRSGLECSPMGSARDALIVVAEVLLILGAMWALGAVFRAAVDLYRRLDVARSRPIKAYLQLVLIVAWMLALVSIGAVVFDQPIGRLLAGAGALIAVLLFIFRDTILSMVASIQLINNDLLAIGDEIDVPDLGVNGVVQDIALHTVTIRGSDKKTTSIPTHKLTSVVFKNWKGIDDAGGRHLRRSIYVDVSSVRHLTPEELERFRTFEPLASYMADKLAEIDKWNSDRVTGDGQTAEIRRLTNVGTFRAYLLEYLKRRNTTETQNLKVMVRQLQPTPHGLPIELYTYTIPTDLVTHEAIAADLMDHILAIVPEFGLRVHQEPSSEDVRTTTPSDM